MVGEKAAQKLCRDTGLPKITSQRSGCGCSPVCLLSGGLTVCVAATCVSSHVLINTDMIA